ncbi:MAG TPA: hypothetical protein PL196_05215 [Burkholderiaceae bacterium]|nr:hypothetical protein [Burkholderiaceae bacterium]
MTMELADDLRQPQALLSLWERALTLDPAARESLLACCLPPDDSAPTLGAQRLRLLSGLQARLGPRLALRARCPSCGEWAAFAIDLDAVVRGLHAADAGPHEIAHGDWRLRYRLPTPADIESATTDEDVERFVQRLLQRCVQDASHAAQPAAVAALPAEVVAALSAAMEALDPAAAIDFRVACPACAFEWAAPFDPGDALWSLLQGDAERLLVEVDMLARRHGWSETEILALSPARRAAYLQLARAG